jgi:hypothetical protein
LWYRLTGPCRSGLWIGTYGGADLQYLEVDDSTFIKNGVTQLKSSPWGYFWSAISLAIPKCHQFSGDSVRFTAYLKNPAGQTASISPYDVSLWLRGSNDTAHVQLLAQLLQYTALQVGNVVGRLKQYYWYASNQKVSPFILFICPVKPCGCGQALERDIPLFAKKLD